MVMSTGIHLSSRCSSGRARPYPGSVSIEELLIPGLPAHAAPVRNCGLSYGNVSARKDENHFLDECARSRDKSHLRVVSQEVLLVTGYDEENNPCA